LVFVDGAPLLKYTLDDLVLSISFNLGSFDMRFRHTPDLLIQFIVQLLFDLFLPELLCLVTVDDMLNHLLPLPERNLSVRVFVFKLEQLYFAQARTNQFVNFLGLYHLELLV